MTDSTRRVEVVRWEQPTLRNESWQSLSLGCEKCPDRRVCGGLRQRAPAYDCTAFCECTQPEKCGKVCKNSINFVARKREIGGFELDDVPRTPRIEYRPLPAVVPLIRNGVSREQRLDAPVVALPLFQIVQATKGAVRFGSREELCDYFKISPSSFIIASGVATDGPLEAWWSLGDRSRIIQRVKQAGVDLVTAPNYSLFSAVPRWDNLHAIKRIGITWSEFQLTGMPAALHVNAASDHDYERWAEFIAERTEVSIIAVEFGTGAGHRNRRPQHIEWLCRLALAIERPLTLIVRGAKDSLGQLAGSFARVVFLDSDAFIKTHKRLRGEVSGKGRVTWRSLPTLPGIALDELLCHNVEMVIRDIGPRIDGGQSSRTAGRRPRRGKTDRRDEKTPELGTLRETELPKGWR